MEQTGQDRVDRRLAAILAADVAGYSRLMGLDEEGTLSQLKAHRHALVDPKIKEHHGRIVKTTGDGMLVEFASVVDAVRCAVEIQRDMSDRNAGIPPDRRIEFRIGINVGDIIIDGDDIFGDGVNVAARLEALAEPGSICVSRSVRDQVRDKLAFGFEDLGDREVKNIARPVRSYRVTVAQADDRPMQAASPESRPPLPDKLTLPDRPSIAVLPFQNMSGDPEQDYFADGIVEDIITALSRNHWLFVIARNSCFTYKGRAVDVKQIGRELGVRYVLEGSVRKAADRMRITGQLIDAATGAHLWADRFDGKLADVFDLQDEVTQHVVGAIAPKLEHAEIERTMRKPTANLDAYDYYLRGMASFHQGRRENVGEALRQFRKAIELDGNFSSAYGMAAWCCGRRKMNGWAEEDVRETAEAVRIAGLAAELGKDDAIALVCGGMALAYMASDFERGLALIDRALALNPNLAMAWHLSGWTRNFAGQPDLAIEHLQRAMRLNPVDPQRSGMQTAVAAAQFAAGRYGEAISSARAATMEQPNNFMAALVAAAANAMAGNLDGAKGDMARARELDPRLRLSGIKDRFQFRRPEMFARWEEALGKAGLPE